MYYEEITADQWDIEYASGVAGLNYEDVKEVVHVWAVSPEGWGSMDIELVLALKDGRFAYFSAWCDTTGWGCQEGASQITYGTSVVELIPEMTADARRRFGYEETPDVGV
jgi:hypothetical protein